MKTKSFVSAISALSLIGLLALPACTTTGQLDVERVARVSREAATIGTTEVITHHQDWRPQFQLAADELKTLETAPTIGVDDLLAIAQRLPVKELKSDTARLSFQGATLLISAIDVPELPADRVAELQPIARAIREGIEAGLAAVPLPPPPTPKPVPAPEPAVN